MFEPKMCYLPVFREKKSGCTMLLTFLFDSWCQMYEKIGSFVFCCLVQENLHICTCSFTFHNYIRKISSFISKLAAWWINEWTDFIYRAPFMHRIQVKVMMSCHAAWGWSNASAGDRKQSWIKKNPCLLELPALQIFLLWFLICFDIQLN